MTHDPMHDANEQGRPARRLAPDGERVARQLAMFLEEEQDALMKALLGSSISATQEGRMRTRAVLIALVSLSLSAAPALGQGDPTPEAAVDPSPLASSEPLAEPDASPSAPADEVVPVDVEATRPTATEVSKNLGAMAEGKHARASYKQVVREAKRFLEANPEAVIPPRNLGGKKYKPDYVFKSCAKEVADGRYYNECTPGVMMLYYAYLVTRDERALDLADRFIGATQNRLPKRYLKVTRDFVDMSVGQAAEYLRAEIDLPPVTDEEHVSIVLVDPGVDPSGVVRLLQTFLQLDRAQARALVDGAPVPVFDDVPLSQAEGVLPYLLVGTAAFGITETGAVPALAEAEVVPSPSPSPLAQSGAAEAEPSTFRAREFSSILDGSYPRTSYAAAKSRINKAFARHPDVGGSSFPRSDETYRQVALRSLDFCFGMANARDYRAHYGWCSLVFNSLYRSYVLSEDRRFLAAASALLGATKAEMPASLFRDYVAELRKLSRQLGTEPA